MKISKITENDLKLIQKIVSKAKNQKNFSCVATNIINNDLSDTEKCVSPRYSSVLRFGQLLPLTRFAIFAQSGDSFIAIQQLQEANESNLYPPCQANIDFKRLDLFFDCSKQRAIFMVDEEVVEFSSLLFVIDPVTDTSCDLNKHYTLSSGYYSNGQQAMFLDTSPSATAAFDLALTHFSEYLASENTKPIAISENIDTIFKPEDIHHEKHTTI